MKTKEKWKIPGEAGAARVIRSPALVRLSGGAVRFLLGAVLAGVELPGGGSPFGTAFVGASGSGADGACALLGAVFGTLCFRGFSAGLRDMAAAVLVFSAAFAFFDLSVYQKVWFMPAVTAAAVGVTGFVCLPAGRVSPAGAASYLISLLLGGAAAYFDRVALSLSALSGPEELGGRQRASLFLFGTVLLMALSGVTVLGGVSLGRVLAAETVLWSAVLGGVGPGAAVGIGAGLAMDLAAGEELYAVAFGFAGLLAGTVRKQGRAAAALTFALAEGLIALRLWERTAGCETLLYEVLMACAVHIALPERLFQRAAAMVTRPGEEHWDRRRAYVKERLDRTAKAFRGVYDNLKESFAPERGGGEEPPFRIFDRAARRVCLGCALRERCWQEEYQATAGALNDGLGAMLERGKGLPEDFPAWFPSRCVRFRPFLEAANEELTALLCRRRYQTRLRESRAAVCRQYGELSRVLEGAALELGRELAPEPVRERRLGRWLAGQEIDGEWTVFFDEYGHLRAEILTGEGERLSSEESRAALSRLFNTPLRPAQVKGERGKSRVVYLQAEPLAATAGVAAKKRDGETVSGDSGSWFKGEDGVLWLLLCDGMGSGPRAGKESALAIRLLETFLRAGMPPEDALRTLNSALALRGEEEGGFTTVDLCRVDLFTGAGAVYKLGAAPTYLRKGDTVVRVTGTTMPAGLTAGERMEADVTPFRLEPGDCLVLLTDGVTDGEEDEWLRGALRDFDGASPKELARRLLEQGAQTAAPDDRTVLVVCIGRR